MLLLIVDSYSHMVELAAAIAELVIDINKVHKVHLLNSLLDDLT